MPVDHSRLFLLARLATLPIEDEAWLWPLRPGLVRLIPKGDAGPPDPSLHPATIEQRWLNLFERERVHGIGKELAQALLAQVWPRSDDPVGLATHYRRLANGFLRPAGDRLELSPRGDVLALGLTRLETLQLAHLVRLRVGPDLLPSLLVSDLPPATRRPLIAAGLVVDDAAMRPLSDLLDQGEPRGAGLADCHVHAGSALRAEFVWPHLLGALDRDCRFFLHQPGSQHALARDTPLLAMAAAVRRILSLLALNRWRGFWGGILAVGRRLDRNGLLRLDDFLDEEPEFFWTETLRGFQSLWLQLNLPPVEEPWLLVESRVAIDADPELPALFDALWWFYARVRAGFHRHFIDDPGLEGLGFFTDVYQRSKAITALRQRVQADPAELMRHLNPLGRLRHLELRIVPDPPAVLHEMLQVAETMAGGPEAGGGAGASLSLVVHAVKWDTLAKGGGVDRAMMELRKHISDLQTLMEIEAPRGLPRFLVGLDVAGRELARPNWFYLPAFVELRDWWRQHLAPRCPGCRGFGYTFHAGEDFVHLAQGLRHIGEVMEFFPWEEGDRVGHGLALGLDPSEWQGRVPMIVSRLDWLLFDLVWEWGLAATGRVPMDPGMRERLAQEIAVVGEALLGTGDQSPERPRTAREWYDFYCALHCPNLVLRSRGFPVAWSGVDRYRASDCDRLWTQPHVNWALERYLGLLDREDEFPLPHQPYPFRATKADREQEALRLRNLQGYLVDLLARRHVAVEACPLSNLTITGIPSLVDHPLLALKDRLPILANTDNPLTFGTDLPLELRMLYEAALERDGNAEQAWRAIREMVESGNRFRFGRPA
jgi:hypothetical protein